MDTNDTDNSYHFDIHASVVYQLGQDLITDEIQALVELVKNAYDADATFAKVTVNTNAGPPETSKFSNSNGHIVIEDNGTGMTPDAIRRGWLTISNSLKRSLKSQNKRTGKGRTPLGDKGLGRLGTQRLGYNVEFTTRPADSNMEYHVSYSWREFATKELLTEVKVEYSEHPATRSHGTTLVISDLINPSIWNGSNAIAQFRTDLSRMISPYEKVQDFTLSVNVNGTRLDLVEFTKQVRQMAQIHYDIRFDGQAYHISGMVRLNFLKPERQDQQPRFHQLVEQDDGDKLFEFLNRQRENSSFGLRRATQSGWYVEFNQTRPIENFDSLVSIQADEVDPPEIANPGPFHGEIDAFDLGRDSAKSVVSQSVFDRASEYREYIKSISGIRVYRDGFAIRVDDDWLKLGSGWTSAASWYGLKVSNTIGFISLSARDNSHLEETTNRESFKITPHYRNFYELLRYFLRFAELAQEFLRRGYNDFLKTSLVEIAKINPDTTTEELSTRLNQTLKQATSQVQLLGELESKLDVTIADAEKSRVDAETQPSLFVNDQQRIQNIVTALSSRLGEARLILAQVEGFVKDVSSLESIGSLLDKRIQGLREQLAQVYEMVSLGMTAEALSHEIRNVADQLAYRTQQLSDYLDKNGLRDPQIITYTEYVYSSLTALQKQLSHLAPSLQYVREKREIFPLEPFLQELSFYYEERLSKKAIKIDLVSAQQADFVLKMNKGKLTQIVDNLLINSAYWLEQQISSGKSGAGLITMELSKPFLRIWDDGLGVDPIVEENLFEAFVSTKGRERGRGLGLYIVKQLLDSDACAISLLTDRNASGRRFVFEIDFIGVLA